MYLYVLVYSYESFQNANTRNEVVHFDNKKYLPQVAIPFTKTFLNIYIFYGINTDKVE